MWQFTDLGLISNRRPNTVTLRLFAAVILALLVSLTAATDGSAQIKQNDQSMSGDFSFRIEPVRPISEIRSEALQLSPPEEDGTFRTSELVELVKLDSTIALNVRYATDGNFMGTVLYEEARAFMQRPAAEAVLRVQKSLARRGLGLVIYDAYRPWYVTWMFWEATPTHQREFVANPQRGSMHNRGCAVDLGLIKLSTGEIIEMPSGYDEFSERAYSDYSGGTEVARTNRAILRRAMEAEGYRVNPGEWWHFDYKDWKSYTIQNRRFSEIN